MGYLEKKGMSLDDLDKQWQGKKFLELVYEHIYKQSAEQITFAMQGIADKMPSEIANIMQEWTMKWKQTNSTNLDSILNGDLQAGFRRILTEAKNFLRMHNIQNCDDDILFNMFNLIILDIAYFAHSNDKFRRMVAAKRNVGCMVPIVVSLIILLLVSLII